MTKDNEIQQPTENTNTNEEFSQEDIDRLNEIEVRTESIFTKGTKVKVLGKTFKVKPLCRWTQNKVLDTCKIKIVDDKMVLDEKTKDNDAKAAAYILLHNPIKIMLFGWIKTKRMLMKYNSETFYAIINEAFNNYDQVFFYKNVSLITMTEKQRMMKI